MDESADSSLVLACGYGSLGMTILRNEGAATSFRGLGNNARFVAAMAWQAKADFLLHFSSGGLLERVRVDPRPY
jgi:hypothetical protein